MLIHPNEMHETLSANQKDMGKLMVVTTFKVIKGFFSQTKVENSMLIDFANAKFFQASMVSRIMCY